MDGQDQDGNQRRKPHGNPNPKRGDIKKRIFSDWTGGGATTKSPTTTTTPGGGGGGGGGDDDSNGCGSYAGGYGSY